MLAAVRIFLGLLTLAAVGRQLALHVQASYDTLNFFSYFTNLSNLFAATVLILTAFPWSTGNQSSRDLLRYVSAVNMTIVGVVFATLLQNADLGALLPWVNFVLHTLMPVAVVADWVVQPPASKGPTRFLILALIFPTVYLTYTLIRGHLIGWFPYPFLDPLNTSGAAGVAAYCVGIAVTYLIVAYVLLAIGNKRREAMLSRRAPRTAG